MAEFFLSRESIFLGESQKLESSNRPKIMKKYEHYIRTRVLALVVMIAFATAQVYASDSFLHAEHITPIGQEKDFIRFHIPRRLGMIEQIQFPSNHVTRSQNLDPLAGVRNPVPSIIHIQSAHGHYEAEKNIQALLHYVTKKYGIEYLFLEGGVGKLRPEFFNLFPARPDLNLKVADYMMHQAEMTGPELFLLEKNSSASKIDAFGIESAAAYRKNRRTFQKVLRQKGQTEKFLHDMDIQIKRIGDFHMGKELREFLNQTEEYELEKVNIGAYIPILKKKARKWLDIDLEDPFYQKDWPMLIRYFRVRKIDKEINQKTFDKEKTDFLKEINRLKITPRLRNRILWILAFPNQKAEFISDLFPAPILRHSLELFMNELPETFGFERYPNVKKYLQMLILQSEFKTDELMREISRLQQRIIEKLARTRVEAKIVTIHQKVQLVRRLMILELARSEFAEASIGKLKPSEMVKELKAIDLQGPIINTEFEYLAELDQIYDLAVEFYKEAINRESFMIQNIKRISNEKVGLRTKPIVIVTGGFHSKPLQEYFRLKGKSYCLISPKITEFKKTNAYYLAMLELERGTFASSQVSNIIKLESLQKMIELDADRRHLRRQMRKALDSLKMDEDIFSLANRKLLNAQYGVLIRDKSLVRGQYSNEETVDKPSRSELRISWEDRLHEWKSLIENHALNATESNLKAILDILNDDEKMKNVDMQETVLSILVYFLAENASLRQFLEPYRPKIEAALAAQFGFVRSIGEKDKDEGFVGPYDRYMTFDAEIDGISSKEVMDDLIEDQELASNWIWQMKQENEKPLEWVRINLPGEIGPLPAFKERPRFIALFLFIVSTSSDFFSPLRRVTSPRMTNREYGLFQIDIGKQDYRQNVALKQTGYFFRLSNAMKPNNLRLLLRQIQHLHLGLLLANAEESYHIFFPGKTPSWINPRMQTIAQAYRAFERSFIVFLRKYNQFLDEPNDIYLLEGRSPEDEKEKEIIREEMKRAFMSYRLEEILFPSNSESGWNEFVSLLRVVEGMELNMRPSKRAVDEESQTLGIDFIQEARILGYHILELMEKLVQSSDMNSSEVGDILKDTGLRDAFEMAGKFWDPFITTPELRKKGERNDELEDEKIENTKYYLYKVNGALKNGTITLAHLADPERFKSAALLYKITSLTSGGEEIAPQVEERSELRNQNLISLIARSAGTRVASNDGVGDKELAITQWVIDSKSGDNALGLIAEVFNQASESSKFESVSSMVGMLDILITRASRMIDESKELPGMEASDVSGFEIIGKDSETSENDLARIEEASTRLSLVLGWIAKNSPFFSQPAHIRILRKLFYALTTGILLEGDSDNKAFHNMRKSIRKDSLELIQRLAPSFKFLANLKSSTGHSALDASMGHILHKLFIDTDPLLLIALESILRFSPTGSLNIGYGFHVYPDIAISSFANFETVLKVFQKIDSNVLKDPKFIKKFARSDLNINKWVAKQGYEKIYSLVSKTAPEIVETSPSRSEIRYFIKGHSRSNVELSKGQVRFSRQIMDGILPLLPFDDSVYHSFAQASSGGRISSLKESVSKRELSQIRNELGNDNFIQLRKIIFEQSNDFAVVTVPIPRGMPRSELRQVLKEFRPILGNHPNKILVLTYEGELPEEFINEFHRNYNRRLFIFQGNNAEILKGLYSGNFSKWREQDREWATKHFLPRANQLLGETAKPGILSRSSFAVGSRALFNEMGIAPAKQLLDQRVEGITPDELLRAYLLLGLSYAAIPNAVLLKEAPGDLFKFEPQSSDDFLQFSLNASKALEIQALIRAAQHLLKSA